MSEGLEPIGMDLVVRSRRKLPHWQSGGSVYFVTYRALRELTRVEREIAKETILFEHGRRVDLFVGVVMHDHVHLLLQPLEESPGKWHSLSKILKSIKGVSARKINLALGTLGKVWQAESYDRIVRNEAEFHEKWTYIWNNAVKAELVSDPNEYEFIVP